MGIEAIGGNQRDVDRVEALGLPRMATYLHETDFHAGRALALYTWNQRVAAAFWPLISITEVALRNSLDTHVGEWCAHQGGQREWLLDPELLPSGLKEEFGGLLPNFITKAENARKIRDEGTGLNLSVPHPRAGIPLTNDDVLAQITLGEWNHFIPGIVDKPDPTTYSRRKNLWDDCASRAFPSITDPLSLHFPLHRAHQFRNRVAHHEPIFNTRLPDQRKDLLTILEATNEGLKEWFLGSDRIPHILKEDPRKR